MESGAPPEGRDKFFFVNRLFEELAPSYDKSNQLTSLGRHQSWRRRAVRLSGVADGAIVLDVATGTGDLALLFAGKAKAVIGLDSSPEMLKIARSKANAAHLQDQVTFTRGDALTLPFPEGTFHCASMGFAGRNVQDLGKAFGEMKRVTRPGYPVLSLEFTRPSGLFRLLFYPYLRYILPILGVMAGGNRRAYAWLRRSIQTFPEVQEVSKRMEEAGLENIRFWRFNMGTVAVHMGWKAGRKQGVT